MPSPSDRSRDRLEELIRINHLMLGAVDPDGLLRTLLQSAVALFRAEACSIAVIDEEEGELVFGFSMGGADVGEHRIARGQGIAGWVAESGEGVICNDVSREPRFFGGVDRETGFQTRSVLCAPMKERERTVGAIEVLNTADPSGFSAEDLELLTLFGRMAGTAIDRVRVLAAARFAHQANQEWIDERYRLVIGDSRAMRTPIETARTVAPRETTVLLQGESGTGKEVLARAIHRWSPRREGPFVAVNCAALVSELMESELFGHERGAFTGAVSQKKGKFELADRGTLFLDEIGELTPNLQVKLLRVLQERAFQRVGGTKEIRTNIRILTATNRNLEQAVRNGAFREDLFYRIHVVSITLPPLRERPEDIPLLAEHFVERFSAEVKCPRLRFADGVIDRLTSYPWPGNIRQLQNVIERAVVLCRGEVLSEADLPEEVRHPAERHIIDTPGPDALPVLDPTLSLSEALDRLKRIRVSRALEEAKGNQAEAARRLGLQPSNLSRLIKTLGLRSEGGS